MVFLYHTLDVCLFEGYWFVVIDLVPNYLKYGKDNWRSLEKSTFVTSQNP